MNKRGDVRDAQRDSIEEYVLSGREMTPLKAFKCVGVRCSSRLIKHYQASKNKHGNSSDANPINPGKDERKERCGLIEEIVSTYEEIILRTPGINVPTLKEKTAQGETHRGK